MITLLLSILSSTIIFVIFKLFQTFRIDTFQAIVANYITAFACGFILYSNQWDSNNLINLNWVPWAIVCSILFISLFFIMGKSSQLNGVGITSVAVKMSMAFSLLMIIIIYRESFGAMKILGISAAMLGIFLITKQDNKVKSNATWMLLILFVGSGILDFSINYVQKNELGTLTPSLFSAVGFGFAGIIGILLLLIQSVRGRLKIEFRNIIAGIILGIPNYFSIYLLMQSYRDSGWKDSAVLAITNVSVVLLSTIIGLILFKEKLSNRKKLGLLCAILAICILAYFN